MDEYDDLMRSLIVRDVLRTYPIESAAATVLIVDRLLADLSAERRNLIRRVIENWVDARERLVSQAVYEQSQG